LTGKFIFIFTPIDICKTFLEIVKTKRKQITTNPSRNF